MIIYLELCVTFLYFSWPQQSRTNSVMAWSKELNKIGEVLPRVEVQYTILSLFVAIILLPEFLLLRKNILWFSPNERQANDRIVAQVGDFGNLFIQAGLARSLRPDSDSSFSEVFVSLIAKIYQ